jgi:KaiC/GvpD/RAD55 family RecA-like ATPase
MEVVSTGIPGLDEALMDGVPKGFTLLVTGGPGAGMELFAKQFAAGAEEGENVSYFTTTERDEDIQSTMDHFGWKADMNIVNIGREYYETVLAKELEVSKYRQEGITMKDIRKYHERGLGRSRRRAVNFLTAITYEVSKLKPPFRLIIDSLDFFLEYYDHHSVLSALRTIKAHTQHYGGIALITMLSNVYDTRTESGVKEIVDCIIDLERTRGGDEFKRFLVIRKVRNRPERTGIYSYTLTDKGITPA